jgi:hypothetical protein
VYSNSYFLDERKRPHLVVSPPPYSNFVPRSHVKFALLGLLLIWLCSGLILRILLPRNPFLHMHLPVRFISAHNWSYRGRGNVSLFCLSGPPIGSAWLFQLIWRNLITVLLSWGTNLVAYNLPLPNCRRREQTNKTRSSTRELYIPHSFSLNYSFITGKTHYILKHTILPSTKRHNWTQPQTIHNYTKMLLWQHHPSDYVTWQAKLLTINCSVPSVNIELYEGES